LLATKRAILWRTPKAASVLEGDYSIRQWGQIVVWIASNCRAAHNLAAVKKGRRMSLPKSCGDGTERHDLPVFKRNGAIRPSCPVHRIDATGANDSIGLIDGTAPLTLRSVTGGGRA
jgi:hypothetical protein